MRVLVQCGQCLADSSTDGQPENCVDCLQKRVHTLAEQRRLLSEYVMRTDTLTTEDELAAVSLAQDVVYGHVQ